MHSKLQPCMENTKSILHRQPIPRLGFIFIKAQIWRSDILTFMSADLYNRAQLAVSDASRTQNNTKLWTVT